MSLKETEWKMAEARRCGRFATEFIARDTESTLSLGMISEIFWRGGVWQGNMSSTSSISFHSIFN